MLNFVLFLLNAILDKNVLIKFIKFQNNRVHLLTNPSMNQSIRVRQVRCHHALTIRYTRHTLVDLKVLVAAVRSVEAAVATPAL